MGNDKFYEHRRLPKKKSKNKSKKEHFFDFYKKDYSLGDLLSDVGNQEVQNFFESRFVQAKLNVSQPRDIYEKEADRIAEEIVKGKSEKVPKISKVQSTSGLNKNDVSTIIESKINSLKGRGNPLEKSVREYFEPRFGVDLGNVRVHTDNNANLLAKSIYAKAFTYGNDIAFDQGQYQPDTLAGNQLIAHELAHTIQQDGGFNDVVQREERRSNYYSGYSTTTPEEYAEKVISAIENSIQFDDFNKARRGFEVIILLPIDTIFRVLKIISSKNSECYVILKHIRLSGFFDKYKRDIIDACFNSVDKNSEIDVDIIKFREDTVSETIKMLWESIRSIKTELNMYENNENKLTELAMYIKNISYQEGYDIVDRAYDLADYHRAKALLQFYENESVEEKLNKETKTVHGICDDYYIPFKGKIFGTIQRILHKTDPELALLIELRKIKSQIIFDTMASFIYLYKKNKITNKGGGEYSNGSMYNEDAKQYIIDNYPDMVKADVQDFTTTTNLRNEKVGEFGFLADIYTDFRMLSRKSIGDIEKEIEDTLNERIKNAKYTIGSLNNDHDLIWELKPAILLSMDKKGISENSEKGKLIFECVQTRETFKIFRSIAFGILGLALGIAGYFTAGSTWAVLPIIGGIAVSSYDLMIEINDYTFHSAASKSMYDFALSVEPSALGIAFAILGLALDVVDVFKAGGKIITDLAERISRTPVSEIDGVIDEAYKTLSDPKNRIIRENVTLEDFTDAVKKGDRRHFDINGNLKTNDRYRAGEFNYIYETDGLGRIKHCETDDLYLTAREKRLSHNPNTRGKTAKDQAGHLFADRFGGSPDIDNLVSQLRGVNLSDYKKIENIWADALKNQQKVTASIDIKYMGNNMRPSKFVIKWTIDGKYFEKTIPNN